MTNIAGNMAGNAIPATLPGGGTNRFSNMTGKPVFRCWASTVMCAVLPVIVANPGRRTSAQNVLPVIVPMMCMPDRKVNSVKAVIAKPAGVTKSVSTMTWRAFR